MSSTLSVGTRGSMRVQLCSVIPRKCRVSVQKCTAMEWDDLRYLLALSRAGSFSEASRQLGVNHTTVSRRIHALERSIRSKLLRRGKGTLVLTPVGEQVLQHAEQIEAQCFALERTVQGRDASLTGRVRITAVDLLASVLSKGLVAFARKHPGIVMEFCVDNSLRDLTRREADVAVRVARLRPPGHLVGRKLGTVAYGCYVAKTLSENETVPWLLWGTEEQRWNMLRWLRKTQGNVAVSMEVDAPSVALSLACEGAGAAVLPCFFGDRERSLVRKSSPEDSLSMELWLLTHQDLRDTARVRAVMDSLAEMLLPLRDAFEGKTKGRTAS